MSGGKKFFVGSRGGVCSDVTGALGGAISRSVEVSTGDAAYVTMCRPGTPGALGGFDGVSGSWWVV